MSRWKIALIFFGLLVFAGVLYAQDLPFDLVESDETRLALELTTLVQSDYGDVAYSWDDSSLLAHCSGFAGRYLARLGLPLFRDLAGPGSYAYSPGSPIPEANTNKQVGRLTLLDSEVGGGFGQLLTAEELAANPTGWRQLGIREGSLIYFASAYSHNGYNEYSHVVVVLGYNSADEPVMADFAAGMEHGPILGRTLQAVYNGIYVEESSDSWDLTPFDLGPGTPALRAYVIDAIGISRAALEADIFSGGDS